MVMLENHPFCLDTGLIVDTVLMPYLAFIDVVDLKKDAASVVDINAKKADAAVNLIVA